MMSFNLKIIGLLVFASFIASCGGDSGQVDPCCVDENIRKNLNNVTPLLTDGFESVVVEPGDVVTLKGNLRINSPFQDYNWLKAYWVSDQDGYLMDTPINPDGTAELIIRTLSKNNHNISFVIEDSNGATEETDPAYVVNGGNISFDHLHVGQRNYYTAFGFHNYDDCQPPSYDDSFIIKLEVVAHDENSFTIRETDQHGPEEYLISVENDTLQVNGNGSFFFGYGSYARTLPLNIVPESMTSVQGWCLVPSEPQRFFEASLDQITIYGKDYENLLVNSNPGNSYVDGRWNVAVYNKKNGIVRMLHYGGPWGLSGLGLDLRD